MSEVALFAVGFVLFVATATATLLFGYLQFQRVYRVDQAASDGPQIVMEGATEVFVTQQAASVPGS